MIVLTSGLKVPARHEYSFQYSILQFGNPFPDEFKNHADGNSLGEGDLRNFAGEIDAAGTTKGVFVTTAGFARAAKHHVARSPKRIVQTDDANLASLMVRHGICVRTRIIHEIKRIAENDFDQEALQAARLSWNGVRTRSFAFIENWQDADCEKGETQSF